jgi:uncharacterized damage-inducible protein DinB
MKKFKVDDLIDKLQNDVKQLIDAAKHLQEADAVKLTYSPAEGSWSVVQCLEHLNAYNRYYLPQIDKATAHISNVYEVKNKMKAPKGYRPERGLNVDEVFKEFYEHQNRLLRLLEVARKRNMNTIRIPISISKFIKLKLGDTFRFLVAHEQRHMIQARNALKALGYATDKFPVILEAVPQ